MRERIQGEKPGRGFLDGLETYWREHREDSLFQRESGRGGRWCFFLHGDVEITAAIARNETFESDLLGPDGSVERIHKVRVKFVCPAGLREEVKGQMRRNASVQRRKEGPHFLPRYRHPVEDAVLYELMAKREVLFFTLLEGEVLRGIIKGFSAYEIAVGMRRDVPVVLLRHAIYDVRDKRGRSYLKKALKKDAKPAGA